MSVLRKVKFATINNAIVAEPLYGFIEYLTFEPVKEMATGHTSQKIIAIYDIDGERHKHTEGTSWESLPEYWYIWNQNDLANAIIEAKEREMKS